MNFVCIVILPKCGTIKLVCIIYTNNGCRHHVYKKNGPKDVELKEVGPRFEMRCGLC